MERKKRGSYFKPVLGKEHTAAFFRNIKDVSKLSLAERETELYIGTGTSARANGGNKPGNTISQYLTGKHSLPAIKAMQILSIARSKDWISGAECSKFECSLYEQLFTNDFRKHEAQRFKALEEYGRRLLIEVFEDIELSTKDVWMSIDLVIAPMLKRQLMEEY